MNRKVRETLQLPKFKNRLVVVWWSQSYICVRDKLNGMTKVIELK